MSGLTPDPPTAVGTLVTFQGKKDLPGGIVKNLQQNLQDLQAQREQNCAQKLKREQLLQHDRQEKQREADRRILGDAERAAKIEIAFGRDGA